MHSSSTRSAIMRLVPAFSYIGRLRSGPHHGTRHSGAAKIRRKPVLSWWVLRFRHCHTSTIDNLFTEQGHNFPCDELLARFGSFCADRRQIRRCRPELPEPPARRTVGRQGIRRGPRLCCPCPMEHRRRHDGGPVLAQNLKINVTAVGRGASEKMQPKQLDAHSDGADRQLPGRQ
jgi:hypothetical protein